MKSKEIRQKFLSFFEERGHKTVESGSLIPDDDSVLFTTAGMQQFKDYYVDKESPYGNKVVTAQKCFRTSDIEEVGDKDHLTFFEMLGNFSFDDYFKKEAIKWAREFLIKEINLNEEKLVYTYFKGDKDIPEDKKAKQILINEGVPEEKIYPLGRDDNFWGPTGKEGPCGPTVEVHYVLKEDGCGPDCDPSCSCDKFIEICNLVFNQFYMEEDKNLNNLKKKGIDTGAGFERLTMVVQKKNSVFETDLFLPLMEKIDQLTSSDTSAEVKRIMADHIKSSVFLISEGVKPSNTDQGYILRRLLRRIMRYEKLIELENKNYFEEVVKEVIKIYDGIYLTKKDLSKSIKVFKKESKKFEKALTNGLKELEKAGEDGELSGKEAFLIYSTYGFPIEMIKEICKEEDIDFNEEGLQKAIEEHKKVSRRGAEKKFGGLSADPKEKEVRLHSATHLLHQSLREVLGEHVRQKGSDINAKRLRFDFSHPKALTEDEIKEVEEKVNSKIKEGLKMKMEELKYEKAVKEGALSFFSKDKYPEKVKVFSFEDEGGNYFSKELCRGPHVKNSAEIGKFKITKEKSSSGGVRRIKAVVE